ncbi:hypothetical protein EV183_004893 [Coemansia sp. RSA 2336]|nr:hypothetical protein EV183_004893 [Coemansia sp. RSA 2336]
MEIYNATPGYFGVRTQKWKGVYEFTTEIRSTIERLPGIQYKWFANYNDAYDFAHKQEAIWPLESKPQIYSLLSRDGTKHVLHAAPVAPPAGDNGQEFVVYTDGSCLFNGQRENGLARGGIGVYFGAYDLRNVSLPLEGSVQTSARAELAAVVHALEIMTKDESFTKYQRIRICTDSQCTIDCFTLYDTYANNFKQKSRFYKENCSLILLGEALIRQLPAQVMFTHVRAHNGIEGNEQADRLAVDGARAGLPTVHSQPLSFTVSPHSWMT